eukprot:g5328.t1
MFSNLRGLCSKRRPPEKIDRPPKNLSYPSMDWYFKIESRLMTHQRRKEILKLRKLKFESAQKSIEETWRLQQERKEMIERYKEEQTLSFEKKLVILCEEQLGFHLKGPNLHALRQRLHFFICRLEIEPSDLEIVLKKAPRLLLASTKRFLAPLARFYKYHGISNSELGKIVCHCPEFMLVPVENDIQLKIEYLKSIGVAVDSIMDLIRCQPIVFTVDIEFDFRRKIDFLLEKGVPPDVVVLLLKCNSGILKHSIDMDTINNEIHSLSTELGSSDKQ